MSLKWKDSTSKCGDAKVEVIHYKGGEVVGAPYDYHVWYMDGMLKGDPDQQRKFDTDEAAKLAAETWLRKQAEKMLKDQGHPQGDTP